MQTVNTREWEKHKGPILDSVNGLDVINCEHCQFVHAVPIPHVDELSDLYQHEYYTQVIPTYIERYQEDLEWWNIVYQERYEEFESLLPSNRRCILDVGSGPGYFLLHGKERGWNTLGVEPSQRAAQHSRSLGLDIVEVFLTADSAKDLGTFDVIQMSEVLEHVPNPEMLLKIAYQLLAPGGIICIVVPNDYNPFQLALRKVSDIEPWWVSPPHHINYFNFDSISQLLGRCGFTEMTRQSTFPIDLFLMMGQNYIGDYLV